MRSGPDHARPTGLGEHGRWIEGFSQAMAKLDFCDTLCAGGRNSSRVKMQWGEGPWGGRVQGNGLQQREGAGGGIAAGGGCRGRDCSGVRGPR